MCVALGQWHTCCSQVLIFAVCVRRHQRTPCCRSCSQPARPWPGENACMRGGCVCLRVAGFYAHSQSAFVSFSLEVHSTHLLFAHVRSVPRCCGC